MDYYFRNHSMEMSNTLYKAISQTSRVRNFDLSGVVFPCATCLLTLTVFDVIDIRPVPYEPIMLRRCTSIENNPTRSESPKLGISLNKLSPSKTSFSNTSKKWESKYFDATGLTYCFKLNVTKFVLQIRTWSYFQHVFLLSTIKLKSEIIFWNEAVKGQYLNLMGINLLIKVSTFSYSDMATYYKDCTFCGSIDMLVD